MPRTGTSSRWGEAGFLAFLLLAALAATAETFRFRIVPWDPLGMAFFPRILLGALVVALLGRLWGSYRDGKAGLSRFWPGIGVLALCMAFVGGIATLGVYLATPPFMVAFALLAPGGPARRTVWRALLASAVLLLMVWGLFDQLLGLRVLSAPLLTG